ncbi:MAG: FAS1-like dehydratase domain-containing protein [Actinomycetes bacterium]
MQVEPTFTSRLAPPSDPYEVSREKIREFARALGDDDPAYRDPAAARAYGHPDVIAPPTFVVLLTMRAEAQAAADAFGGDLDLAHILHRDQRFTYTRPVRATDRLVVTPEVEDREIDGRHVLTLRTEVRTTDSEHVCTATSVMVYTEPEQT